MGIDFNIINKLSFPDLQIDNITISFSKNYDSAGFDAYVANDEKPDKILDFNFKLSILDKLDKNTKKGTYFNNSSNDNLRFKTVLCFSEEEERFYSSNLYAVNKDKNPKKVNIFSLDNFKFAGNSKTDPANTKFINTINTRIYKQKTKDINYLSLIHVGYYDPENIIKQYSLTPNEVEQIEKYFFGDVKIVKIIVNNKIENSISPKVIDYSILEKSIESTSAFLTSKNNKRKSNNENVYFSHIFASKDVLKTDFKINGTYANNVIRYGFFFDYERYLYENCAFSLFVKNFDNDLKKQFLQSSKLVDFSFYRYRTDFYDLRDNNQDTIISNKFIDEIPESTNTDVKQSDLEKLSITEKINISSLPGLYFFNGIDLSAYTLTSGTYKYKTRIKIQDGSYAVLASIRNKLLDNLSFLRKYYNEAIIPESFYTDKSVNNPHITLDASADYVYKAGNYNPLENIFNNNLKDKYSATITDIINYFSKIYYLLSVSNNNITKKETDRLKEDTKALAYSSAIVILPGTGNPEGLSKFITMNNNLVNTLDYILSSMGSSTVQRSYDDNPPKQKNIQLLEIEQQFLNFEYSSEDIRGFGFSYFSNTNNSKRGLVKIAYDSSGVDVKSYIHKLYEIYLPNANSFSELPVYFANNNFKNINEYYNAIDNLLSRYGSEDFYSLIFDKESISEIISTSNSLKDTNTKNINKQFSKANSSFNSLLNNNIHVKINSLPQNNSEILSEAAVKQLRAAIYNTKVFNRAASGINYFSQPSYNTSNSFNDFLNLKSEVYKNINTAKIDLSDQTQISRFKVTTETSKKIQYITFRSLNGVYLLKDPVFVDMEAQSPVNKYLCCLNTYIPDASIHDTTLYSKIPVFNQFFIYDKTQVAKLPSATIGSTLVSAINIPLSAEIPLGLPAVPLENMPNVSSTIPDTVKPNINIGNVMNGFIGRTFNIK